VTTTTERRGWRLYRLGRDREGVLTRTQVGGTFATREDARAYVSVHPGRYEVEQWAESTGRMGLAERRVSQPSRIYGRTHREALTPEQRAALDASMGTADTEAVMARFDDPAGAGTLYERREPDALDRLRAAERRAADASYRHAGSALTRAMAQGYRLVTTDGRYLARSLRTKNPPGEADLFVADVRAAHVFRGADAEAHQRHLEARGLTVHCERVEQAAPRRVGWEPERVHAAEHIEAVSDHPAPESADRHAGGWGE